MMSSGLALLSLAASNASEWLNPRAGGLGEHLEGEKMPIYAGLRQFDVRGPVCSVLRAGSVLQRGVDSRTSHGMNGVGGMPYPRVPVGFNVLQAEFERPRRARLPLQFSNGISSLVLCGCWPDDTLLQRLLCLDGHRHSAMLQDHRLQCRQTRVQYSVWLLGFTSAAPSSAGCLWLRQRQRPF